MYLDIPLLHVLTSVTSIKTTLLITTLLQRKENNPETTSKPKAKPRPICFMQWRQSVFLSDCKQSNSAVKMRWEFVIYNKYQQAWCSEIVYKQSKPSLPNSEFPCNRMNSPWYDFKQGKQTETRNTCIHFKPRLLELSPSIWSYIALQCWFNCCIFTPRDA